MFLRKLPTTSNASRNIVKLTSTIFDKKKYNFLFFRKYSRGGRSITGRCTLWSKGSLLNRFKLPRINYRFRQLPISFVSTFYLTPFNNKLVALCFLSNGSVTYLQSSNKFKLFSFIFFSRFFLPILPSPVHPTLFIIMHLKTLSKISLIELFPGAGVQYVRSPGVVARFININWWRHTAVVELPSGVRKNFSLYSAATLGEVSLKLKRNVRNTKSGFWRGFGLKSSVRGVAMNPIDHPHGGRTKAIKNHRTPWGKPTKLK